VAKDEKIRSIALKHFRDILFHLFLHLSYCYLTLFIFRALFIVLFKTFRFSFENYGQTMGFHKCGHVKAFVKTVNLSNKGINIAII